MTEEPARCGLRCLRPQLHDHNRCADLTYTDLGSLPRLYTTLKLHLAPNQGTGDRVTGSREKPLALRADIHDHMADLRDKLREWTRYVTDERNLAGPSSPLLRQQRRIIVSTIGTTRIRNLPDRDMDASLVVERSTWLLRHHGWLSERDISVDYGEEIRTLAHRARQLAGLYEARPEAIAGVPCRRCSAYSLARVPGSRYAAECTGELGNDRGDTDRCGALYTEQEYRDWVSLNAAYAKQKGKTA